MSIIQRVPWTVQPQGLARIDWSNPLTKGLVFAIIGNCQFPRDIVSGKLPTLSHSTTTVTCLANSKGLGVNSQTGYLNYGRTGADSITVGTVLAVSYLTTATENAIVSSGENVAGHGFEYYLDNTVRVNNGFYFSCENFGYLSTSGFNVLPSVIQPNVICTTWDGTTVTHYANGRQIKQEASAALCVADATRVTRLTYRNAQATVSQLHVDDEILIFNRPLVAAEAKALTANPWQIFAPQTRRIWAPSAGGSLDITATLGTATAGGFNATVDRQLAIAATLGTATAGGFNATVDRQLAIAATLGTATADGFTATVNRQLAIAATLGTATADGFTATVNRQLAIAATLGTATADGFTATVNRQLAIAATLGTATADGFTATVTLGNDLNISATLGTAAADGFNATIDRQLAIAALLGTATASGFAATVTFGNDLNISATLGTAAADGFNANIDRQLTIAALLGQSIADGFAATISSGGGMTLTAADLAAIDALITAQLPNIAAAVLAAYVEGTTTIQQSLRISNAVLGGKVSGAGTGTEIFRDLANTKDRIVATVDSSGNRTAITRDLS